MMRDVFEIRQMQLNYQDEVEKFIYPGAGKQSPLNADKVESKSKNVSFGQANNLSTRSSKDNIATLNN